MAQSFGEIGDQVTKGLGDVGLRTAQAGLIAGGMITAFFLPSMMGKDPVTRDLMWMMGLGLTAAGVIWWGKDTLAATGVPKAAMSTIEPTMIYNPIETRQYTNPVNNLQAVPPRNRFDKQTNYIMNRIDTNTDTYLNNLIISEAKALGFGNIGNYPVRLQPHQVKSLIPTTQVEPSRDTNTVKMLA